MVFALLITVYAQNAFSVEETGYWCELTSKEWRKGIPNCQRGDMISIFDLERAAQVCETGTIVVSNTSGSSYKGTGGRGSSSFACIYRGSLRQERQREY